MSKKNLTIYSDSKIAKITEINWYNKWWKWKIAAESNKKQQKMIRKFESSLEIVGVSRRRDRCEIKGKINELWFDRYKERKLVWRETIFVTDACPEA